MCVCECEWKVNLTASEAEWRTVCELMHEKNEKWKSTLACVQYWLNLMCAFYWFCLMWATWSLLVTTNCWEFKCIIQLHFHGPHINITSSQEHMHLRLFMFALFLKDYSTAWNYAKESAGGWLTHTQIHTHCPCININPMYLISQCPTEDMHKTWFGLENVTLDETVSQCPSEATRWTASIHQSSFASFSPQPSFICVWILYTTVTCKYHMIIRKTNNTHLHILNTFLHVLAPLWFILISMTLKWIIYSSLIWSKVWR